MAHMKVTVLGCGTSHGVPMIACDCSVCRSSDPRNNRLRPSIMVTTTSGANIIVDTPPEMRIALLRNNVRRLDALLFTHSHADHIFGADDIRSFNYRQNSPIPVYAEANVLQDIHRIYEYIFVPTQNAGGKPQVQLIEIEPFRKISLDGVDVMPLRIWHGRLPILAYKFGLGFAYVTDVNRIPDESWPYLENLDLLMLDAVRRDRHETHFNLEEALAIVARLKPKQTLLTHLSHDFDYVATNRELPPTVNLAYDNLTVDIPD